MTDEEHSDSRTTDSYTEDDYEEVEDAYDDEGLMFSFICFHLR